MPKTLHAEGREGSEEWRQVPGPVGEALQAVEIAGSALAGEKYLPTPIVVGRGMRVRHSGGEREWQTSPVVFIMQKGTAELRVATKSGSLYHVRLGGRLPTGGEGRPSIVLRFFRGVGERCRELLKRQ